jgi:hypothetical protein
MEGYGNLSKKQQRGIISLLESSTVKEAAKKSGADRSTMHRWLKDPKFKAALEEAKNEQFRVALEQLRSLVPLAVQGLKELALSSNDQVRLRTCAEILKAAGTYGTQASVSLALEDLDLQSETAYRGELSEKVLKKLASGEVPPSLASQLLKTVNNIEERREALTFVKLWTEGVKEYWKEDKAFIEAEQKKGKSIPQIRLEQSFNRHKERRDHHQNHMEHCKKELEKVISSSDSKPCQAAEEKVEAELE